MKIKYFVVLAFLMQILVINAQDFRMGRVSVDELKETSHPADSSAAAAILYKKGVTNIVLNPDGSFAIRTDVETRIKIYKKEGLDYANFSISYYTRGEKESVTFNNAVTYNLVNDKIEKTKIKREGEFTEEINENWTSKKIVLPNVKEGSVIEFKYTLRSPYLSTIPDWYFQQGIPVNYVSYETYIPEFFTYRINLNSTDITTKEEKVHNPKNYSDLKTSYLGKNLPAIKAEEYVTNIRNYAANVKHELARTQFPNSMIKNYVVSWEDVVKSIYDYNEFGNELKQSSYFEDDIKEISQIINPVDRMNAVLNLVQNKMTWNNKYGYLCKDGVRKAYRNGTGNVAEINLILTRILRSVGLQANPVLVSTRSNGISVFPSKNAFDYVITCVEMNNKKYLLDATSKYAVANILPTRVINYSGRIIRDDKSSEEVRLVPEISSRKVIFAMMNIDESGKVSGRIKHQFQDYEAFDFRETYVKTSEDSYLENLEKRLNGIEVENYKRTNSEDLGKPLIEDFSIVANNLVDIIADKLYLTPTIYYQRKRNPFTTEKRNYPIDFVYPFQEKFNFSYAIPESYEVESLPQSTALALPDGLGMFRYVIEVKGNQIQVAVDLAINQAVVSEVYYPDLKEFFKHIVEKQSEKIVLKRI